MLMSPLRRPVIRRFALSSLGGWRPGHGRAVRTDQPPRLRVDTRPGRCLRPHPGVRRDRAKIWRLRFEASLTAAALARTALIATAVLLSGASQAGDPGERARSWESTWEARQAREAERRRVESLRRAYEFRRALAHARLRSEGDVGAAMRASTPPAAEAMCPVLSSPDARRAFHRELVQRREQAFRRATGLPLQTELPLRPAAKRSKTNVAVGVSPAMAASAHAVSTAVFAAASASSSSGLGHMVPLFPSATDALGRQGFARVINHSGEAGEVSIEAFDDEGASHGPVTLSIGAGETVHFNSNDLEDGNAGKRLTGGTGPGQGDWRLEFESELDIEVLSYIRTTDGFLTAMHDMVPVVDGRREAAIFNPGSNADQESLLRLVNPADADATVTIAAVDDKGMSPGERATATIPAGASRTYAAAELESGSAAGLEGAIGDGTGKWRLELESEREIVAMSLLSSPTGHLTNLSTAPDNEEDGVHAVPLFPSASDAQGRQGFLRVMNRSEEAGEVAVRAFDDTERAYEVLTLVMGANETKHFNSDDLELGNADKGLVGSAGAGEGDWRLELTSELDIEVLSYIRTTDGFLTAMHDLVPRSAKRHRVAVFNPGSNVDQQSVLRLVNPGEEPAEVTIAGFDDRDASPGSDVVVTVPADGSASHTAAELESGSEEFEGALGNGSGKWRLTVNADRPIAAMSLLSSPTGHLTNLSTAPERGAGPAETAPEAHEALISPIVQSKCVNCHVEGGQSGHTPLVFVRATDADHLAKNLKAFENYLAEVEDGSDRILNKIQGALAHGGGVQVSAGTEEYGNFQTFMELLGAEVESPAIMDLFADVTLESPRRTLWRAAIVFAGRIPTAAEYAMVEGGTEDDLRREIRSLMEGPGFHEFLIRASNDRLLTDREIGDPFEDGETFFVDNTNKRIELEEANWRELVEYLSGSSFGAGRGPLELIAHVAEKDLDYRQILTADYIMANPMAAEAYGSATTDFVDPKDRQEFRPSEIASYYRRCEGQEIDEETGYVHDPGPCSTDYPHAGILNTKVFLQRYPTTATNRNRARSRWTYYHFLGFDIEKSESRTMDPKVLEDTNNPTMNNRACTACHERMDPVAGAFQNYGENGLYRDQDGGLDSLDGDYKYQGPVGGHDVPVTLRSEENYETFSIPGRLRTGDNDIGLLNIPGGECCTHILVDSLTILNDTDEVVGRYDLENMEDWDDIECGNSWGSLGVDIGCRVVVSVQVPKEDDYTIEVATRIGYQSGEAEAEGSAGGLRIWAPMRYDYYHDGDTWYRDMRKPGFVREPGSVVELVSDEEDHASLRWLAERIVEDERFAEAAVKFWWPSIMGSEVVEQPEEGGDADFDALQLAATVQSRVVERLAAGFRRGFGWSGQSAYNLKDLLVEIVVSDWFRADSGIVEDSVRKTALRDAGARRLLTPEELARKTAAVTGFQWGRQRSVGSHGEQDPARLNSLADPTYYGLLYGGIDSDGITLRARDITSVMAAVANTHALASSCPTVLREFYLLPDGKRRLFGGIDTETTPTVSTTLEFAETVEILAETPAEMEVVSVGGQLRPGPITVRFAKERQLRAHEGEVWRAEEMAVGAATWVARETVSWEVSLEAGDNALAVWPASPHGGVNLDRLYVEDADGREVTRQEFEDLPIPIENQHYACGEKPINRETGEYDHLRIWGDRFVCAARPNINVGTKGSYTLNVVAWGDVESGGTNARVAVAVNPEPAPVVVWLEELDVRDEQGRTVEQLDIGRGLEKGSLEFSVNMPNEGQYDIAVSAWASNLGDDPAEFQIIVESFEEVDSPGGTAIRNKLVELHDKLLGIKVGPDSPDVETAYRLFFHVWQRKRESEAFLNDLACHWSSDHRFLDGFLDDTHEEGVDEDFWSFSETWDWDRASAFVRGLEAEDPQGVARAWVVVMVYLLTDYRYLYL